MLQIISCFKINGQSKDSSKFYVILDSSKIEQIDKMYKNRKIVFACTFVPSVIIGLYTGFTFPFLTTFTIILINEIRIIIIENKLVKNSAQPINR